MTRTKALDLDGRDLSVAGLTAAYRDGRVSAEDLTRALLDRIAARDGELNALIFLDDGALATARSIDARRAAGEPLGPLAGIPVVVKDTMDMVGHPTTGGWRVLSSRAGGTDLLPTRDCPVVARMREAGCVLLGKTNVPILSASGSHADDSWAGPTLNAFAPGIVPGASSAGSATAVAAGFATIGLAEETGGSIQNPAAAQGLVGIKPTFALVPNTGILPLGTATLDVVGPVARRVADVAIALDVLAGPHPDDPKTATAVLPEGGFLAALTGASFVGRRLGLWGTGWRAERGWRGRPLHPAIADAYGRACRRIASAGATLVEDPFAGSGFADLAETVGGLEDYDVRGMEGLPNDLERYFARFGADAPIRGFADLVAVSRAAGDDPFAPSGVLSYLGDLEAFRVSASTPGITPDRAAFEALRVRYRAILDAVFDHHGLDALVFPQMADPLPRRGEPRAIRETTVCEINIAGLPGVVVPAGRLPSREPFALIFVGRAGSDAGLLALARAWEFETDRRTFDPSR